MRHPKLQQPLSRIALFIEQCARAMGGPPAPKRGPIVTDHPGPEERVLSSAFTAVHQFAGLISLGGFLGVGLSFLISAKFTYAVSFLAVAGLMSFLFYKSSARLKHVGICDDHLLISDSTMQILVHRSQIEAVTRVPLSDSLKVHFRTPTPFGWAIVFLLPAPRRSLFEPHPIEIELRHFLRR